MTLERCPRLTTWGNYGIADQVADLAQIRGTSCAGVVEESKLKECDGQPSFDSQLKRCMDETW